MPKSFMACRSQFLTKYLFHGFLIILLLPILLSAEPIVLQNSELELLLDIDSSGLPFIKQVSWRNNREAVFFSDNAGSGLKSWAENNGFITDTNVSPNASFWVVESDPLFHKARACWQIQSIEVVMHVDLAEQDSVIRVSMEVINHGPAANITSFPIWFAELNCSETSSLFWWDALRYIPHHAQMQDSLQVTLHSKTYSSDTRLSPGQVPFWMISGNTQSLGFGLAWSGGWQAQISRSAANLELKVFLPPEETQLNLATGDNIIGPALEMIPIRADTEAKQRQQWLQKRQAFACRLWNMPATGYPLIYNHWYSVRFDLSSQFIRNQLEAMGPYEFDSFVIDAGWYKEVGNWIPDPDKFKPGEWEDALRKINRHKIQVGLWTCPWLKHIESNQKAPEIDEPPYYNKYLDAYSLDLAGIDFTSILNRHITVLEQKYGMNWWKYDQEFTGPLSRHGRMKKITALQNALETIRRQHPKLTIESCLSGGRMINAFTDAIAQIHWIRDGNASGYKHGKSNIEEALGAVQFLSPAKVERWTNRPDTLDAANPEVLKWYCRSCMIGVWGISADLHLINEVQRQVILSEIKHYRTLNQFKSSLNYQIQYPDENHNVASIIFYNDTAASAGVLAFRWNGDDTINENLRLDSLSQNQTFEVNNVDQNTTVQTTSLDLAENGIPISFMPGELSKIYFIHKVSN